MTGREDKTDYSTEGHLPESTLLHYLDGELPSKEADLVQKHLVACWSCRMNASHIQEVIFAFVKYRDDALQSFAMPPSDESRFVMRLENLREQLGKRSWLASLSDSWRRVFSPVRPMLSQPLLMGVLGGLVVAVSAIAVYIWLDRVLVVTANELLQNVSEAQAKELHSMRQPVLYQKLQIKRGTRTAWWELWRDTVNERFKQSVVNADNGLTHIRNEDSLSLELMEVLRVNRMNPQQPLSAASFESWRQSLGAKYEEVSRSQTETGKTLTLRVSRVAEIAEGQIVEASLVVREHDWRPQAQLLKVEGRGGIREYELRETAYDVIPLAALTIFNDPPPHSSLTRVASGGSVVLSNPLLPSKSELQHAEVAAVFALHQRKADLGEQIEVVEESGARIVVRGHVDTGKRKEELIASLKVIPWVEARIQTFDELTEPSAKVEARSSTVNRTNSNNNDMPPPGMNLFEQRLAKYFAESADPSQKDGVSVNRRISHFANSVFAESSAALVNGWALRRLSERFDDELDKPTSVDTRLLEIISNHLTAIKMRTHHLHTQFEPTLLTIAGTKWGGGVLSVPMEATRRVRIMRLFNAIEMVHQSAYLLFDSRHPLADSPESAAGLMLDALAQLDVAIKALEQDIHK